jgi:hypothetical protein
VGYHTQLNQTSTATADMFHYYRTVLMDTGYHKIHSWQDPTGKS